MRNEKPLLFFDTVVLSNFAFASDGIHFLKNFYKTRGVVTFQVLQEIAKATHAGYHPLEKVNSHLILKNGFQKVSLSEKEFPFFIGYLKNLGEGEASCIAAAHNRKGIVVTDDRLARNTCKEKNIPVTGTIGILKAACLANAIQIHLADEMLHQMIEHGFYSPVQKISTLL